ncbi:MAG: bifunctional riboflavin kinase/FAD synthetase, partial [Betaproteobacteria bacterium]|nr:bifunctional riboflavin kinase/FAD synthetase [Betaproteobacteria bacterium]
MRIVRDINKFTEKPIALTVGNFDGMHKGHRALVDLIVRRAAGRGWKSGVLSFEPHPLAVLRGFPVRRIGGVREKINQLSAVNILFLLRFTKNLSMQSGAEFASLIFDRLGVRYLAVGENFRFGRGRAGDISLLRAEGKRRGAEVESAPLRTENGAPISSGRIRESLRMGNFAEAEILLGRPWTISGRVGWGRGFGQKIGYPTANLMLHFTPVCEGI